MSTFVPLDHGCIAAIRLGMSTMLHNLAVLEGLEDSIYPPKGHGALAC